MSHQLLNRADELTFISPNSRIQLPILRQLREIDTLSNDDE